MGANVLCFMLYLKSGHLLCPLGNATCLLVARDCSRPAPTAKGRKEVEIIAS